MKTAYFAVFGISKRGNLCLYRGKIASLGMPNEPIFATLTVELK